MLCLEDLSYIEPLIRQNFDKGFKWLRVLNIQYSKQWITKQLNGAAIMNSGCYPYFSPIQPYVYFSTNLVRTIKRMNWVQKQLEVKFTDFGHHNKGCVNWCILLMKNFSFKLNEVSHMQIWLPLPSLERFSHSIPWWTHLHTASSKLNSCVSFQYLEFFKCSQTFKRNACHLNWPTTIVFIFVIRFCNN